MSAPNQGRQSPDPENQAPKQATAQQANPNQQGAAPSQDHAKDKSEQQKSEGLSSNPTGPMDHAAEEKTKKGQGNEPLGGK